MTEQELQTLLQRNPDLRAEGVVVMRREEPERARAYRTASWVPSEAQEQRVVVEWAERHKGKWPELALLFHVPNGGARDAREAALLVAEGVKRGVPDLLLPVPQGGYVGLALELKRADHSSQPTAEQLIWHNAMRLNRWRVDVSYGADEAIAVLDEYLSQKDDPA